MSIAEKLITVAENVPKVYEAGQKSEYDRFWDAYQQYGNRTDYQRCFSGSAWNEKTLKPKYDIKPTYGGAAAIFQSCGFVGSLKNHFETLGVKLDFSKLVGVTQPFYAASFVTEIPDLDLSGCVNGCSYLFYQCTALKAVKLIVNDGIAIANNSFTGCTALEELRFEGTIGQSLDLHWSTKLSAESLASIVFALSDTVTGQTITLPTTAEATYDAYYGDGYWTGAVSNRPNWTFAYA